MTSGVLLQSLDGVVRIIADWVRDGDPGGSLRDIVQAAGIEATKTVRLIAGPAHFSQYDTIGLRAAVTRLPAELRRGGAEAAGREEMRALLRRTVRTQPALLISQNARWTLNGF